MERRRIIIRDSLHVVPQQRVLLDHLRTLLLFRRNGLLAAILGVRNQNSELVDTSLEGLHIAGWSRERRIAVHAVVRSVELLEHIGIRRSTQPEQCLDLCYYCCHTILLLFLCFPALETTASGEGGRENLLPNPLSLIGKRTLISAYTM